MICVLLTGSGGLRIIGEVQVGNFRGKGQLILFYCICKEAASVATLQCQ